jgi:Tir chaperone family protein CesT
LNATEMMHGAYGLEGGKIVISDALQLENLDFNEFQATIDDITLAVADHYSRLAKFQEAAA